MRALFTSPGPAVKAARSGLSGRRVQTVVIGLVLLVSTAASTLALGLLVDSNAPFDHAFAAQHGSQVTATAQATNAQLAATAHLPGVTAVRDSKRPDGGAHVISRDSFAEFLADLKRGRYDLE